MEFRTMDITLYSVGKTNDVDFSKKMAVYAVVSISGGDETSIQETRTPADANLTWNFPMKFKVDEAELQQNRLNLDFKLVGDDKDLGVLSVPIKELLDSPAKALADGMKFLVYPVRKRNGEPKGQLSFTCKLSDPATSAPPPPPSYWGLMKEKIDYGVKVGGSYASSAVELGGGVASTGVELVKVAAWEAKKKLEERAEKRIREELAQKRIDVRKKEVEESRKKREEEVAARKRKEELAKRRKEEEAAMKRKEELAKKRKEEEAAKKRKEEEAAKKRKEEAAKKKKEEEELAKKRADLGKNSTQNQTDSLYTKFTSGLYPTTDSLYTKFTSGLYSTTQTGVTTLMTQTGLVPGQTTDMSQATSSQVGSRQSKA